jgi:hypothetical protein
MFFLALGLGDEPHILTRLAITRLTREDDKVTSYPTQRADVR